MVNVLPVKIIEPPIELLNQSTSCPAFGVAFKLTTPGPQRVSPDATGGAKIEFIVTFTGTLLVDLQPVI